VTAADAALCLCIGRRYAQLYGALVGGSSASLHNNKGPPTGLQKRNINFNKMPQTMQFVVALQVVEDSLKKLLCKMLIMHELSLCERFWFQFNCNLVEIIIIVVDGVYC